MNHFIFCLLHNRIFLFTVRTQLTDHLELLMKKRRCSDDWWCLNYKSPLSCGTIQPTQAIFPDQIKSKSLNILVCLSNIVFTFYFDSESNLFDTERCMLFLFCQEIFSFWSFVWWWIYLELKITFYFVIRLRPY